MRRLFLTEEPFTMTSLAFPKFYKTPLLAALLSMSVWILFAHFRGQVMVYGMKILSSNFGIISLSIGMVGVLWLLIFGLMVDFLGAKRSLGLFAGINIICSLLWALPLKQYTFHLAFLFSGLSQILLMLCLLKIFATYYQGRRFLPVLSTFFVLNVLFTYLSTSSTEPPLLSVSAFHQLGIGFALLFSVLFLVLAVILPSVQEEKNCVGLMRFRDILRPLTQFKAWGSILVIGMLLAFVEHFFYFLVGVYFPNVLEIHEGGTEASVLFGAAFTVGILLYGIVFQDSPDLSRVLGLSLLLAILALLGIGFLSMSEVLVWSLVALTGLFLGSTVLLFRILALSSNLGGFATGCALAFFVSGILYVLLFHIVGRALHEHMLGLGHLWLCGVLYIAVAAILSASLGRLTFKPKTSSGAVLHLKTVLISYWRGGASLGSAFWLLSLLGRWIVMLSFFWILLSLWMPLLAEKLAKSANYHPSSLLKIAPFLPLGECALLLSVFGSILGFYLMVSVWRCGRSAYWVWRYLSRVVVTVSFLRNIIFLMFALTALWLHFYNHFPHSSSHAKAHFSAVVSS